jgi:hypothetical protein
MTAHFSFIARVDSSGLTSTSRHKGAENEHLLEGAYGAHAELNVLGMQRQPVAGSLMIGSDDASFASYFVPGTHWRITIEPETEA